jgi:N-formylglutamate amidohydrolase
MAITNNEEPKPDPLGSDAHDGSFEGSTTLYAEHLVNDHGFTEAQVAPFKGGAMQGDWNTLDRLHRAARSLHS